MLESYLDGSYFTVIVISELLRTAAIIVGVGIAYRVHMHQVKTGIRRVK